MSFFEAEFPRAIEFEQDGGRAFNTDPVPVQSGQEQRNRVWLMPVRGEYTASVVAAQNPTGSTAAFVEQVRTFFYLIGGQADAFRYFDPIDNSAGSYAGHAPEALQVIPGTSNLQWQLGKNYSLGGRSLFLPITKPIGPGAIDYMGNAFTESVVIHSGVSPTSIDHTTGIVLFPSAPTAPTADFQYHVPVRLNTDKFNPKVVRSAKANRIVRWNFGLVIVAPPNY